MTDAKKAKHNARCAKYQRSNLDKIREINKRCRANRTPEQIERERELGRARAKKYRHAQKMRYAALAVILRDG